MAETLQERINRELKNKAKRNVVCFLIDTSMSMSIPREGTNRSRIDIVNERLPRFLNDMAKNSYVKEGLAVSIITFGNKANVLVDFTSPDRAIVQIGTIKANESMTNLGAGAKAAYEHITDYTKLLDAGGIEYYHPMLLIITDGDTTDLSKTKEAAKVISADRRVKVSCYNIGKITESARKNLRLFVRNDDDIKNIDDMKLGDFFEMLSRSLTTASVQAVEADLNMKGLD